MLVLKRREGETLCIGDNVKVTILKIRGSQAAIGIDAPPEMEVDRSEIRLKKQLEGPREIRRTP